ncbi:MAG: DUF72 domain-containing protein [Pigmentiphaga sp.]|uniref:DUF72 domain-containing protein n=1 Tax=Pigmentiphaga sp. TaxID=1977564 RepID=UPI0029A9E9A7|nr:DUF72 domain-containing protein [Pigmentiphaga sp.]MDX3907658.1 DUF72 domain-containing protein [Pigmentiphaga sp.]
MSDIRVGISGWRYAPWRGVFYPDALPQRLELAYASREFSTIELNGSFYSLQRPERYADWYAATPRGFLFSIKGPRYLTHILRLKEIDRPLANFLASGIFELKEKLGPILWQFPPTLRFDPERFEPFFRALPRDTDQARAMAARHEDRMRDRSSLAALPGMPMRHAIEVRHESFVDPAFVQMLRHHRVALVVADTAGKWPYKEDVTADFVYIRLHGDKELYVSGYTDAALDRWGKRIAAWNRGSEPRDAHRIGAKAARSPGRDVFCYFDNDAKVEAPRNAKTLMRKLGLPMRADGGA